MPSIKPLCSFLAAAALFAAMDTALAASKIYTGKGQGKMDKGREACLAEAIEDGKRAAVRRAMKGIGDGVYRPLIHNPIVADAARFVGKVKASGAKYGLNGRCQVTVKAQVDVSSLQDAMNRVLGDGTLLAVVVRYYVNGELAGDAGVNELEASNAAMQKAQDLGCRTISLHEHYRIFSRKLKPQWQAVTGDDLAKEEPITESESEALGRIIRDLNERLMSEGTSPTGGELLDLIVIGEVNVSDAGEDLDSARYKAEATIGMSLHQLSTLESFGAAQFTQLGVGPTKAVAMNNAMGGAIGEAISSLNDESENKRKAALCASSQ